MILVLGTLECPVEHTPRSSGNGVERGNKCSILGRQGRVKLGAWSGFLDEVGL